MMKKRILLLSSLLALLLLAGNLDQAQAQIQVNFKLNKKVYMAHEAVAGQLYIVNRSGRDLIIEGRNSNMSWLDFQVTDSRGNLLSPVPGRRGLESVIIRSGGTFKKQVYVNRRYPMGQKGVYRIRASVYFPPLKRYFQTKIQSLQITEGSEFWSQVVGVPPGYKEAGTFRKFAVLRFDYRNQKEIYFRLSRSDSGAVITTYSLGKLLMVTDPSVGIDSQNRLHILHMGAPQAYAHTIIDVEGKAEPQKYYFAKGENRPKLVRVGSGAIVVEGGIPEDMQDAVYEKNEFHKLSELPPGMPIN
ncbi:MAG: hypothetical protein QM496_02240 [Verrucomicrobiota bacterium]